MSALLMGRAFYADLPARVKFVLVALADHANDDGTGVHVGQARIGQKVGLSARQVRRYLEQLRTLGFVERVQHGGSNRWTGTTFPDTYRLNVDRIPEVPRRAITPDTGGRSHDITADIHDRNSGHPGSITPDIAMSAKPSEGTIRQPPVLRSEFELFWTSYPPRDGRRDKKAEAWAEWQKLKPSPDLQAQMRSALGRYRTEKPVDACRWLKYRRWEDDVGLTPTRPRAMAAGGVPMRTYEESQARAAAEAAERERRRAAWEAAQAAKGATA